MTEGVGRRSVTGTIAGAVTEVCSPAVVVVALSLAVAWQATGYRIGPALWWGMIVAVFSSLLPMALIVRGARRGRWDGHHVRNREGRLVPMLLALTSTLLGLAVLLLGGPRDLVALDVAMLTTLLVCTVITQWWKISLHSAVAGGATATMVLLYGPLALVLVPLVALIMWSRVIVRDHTVAQTIAGALVGPAVGGVVFVLVR